MPAIHDVFFVKAFTVIMSCHCTAYVLFLTCMLILFFKNMLLTRLDTTDVFLKETEEEIRSGVPQTNEPIINKEPCAVGVTANCARSVRQHNYITSGFIYSNIVGGGQHKNHAMALTLQLTFQLLSVLTCQLIFKWFSSLRLCLH